MEKCTLEFYCKDHRYSSIVFSSYGKAIDYLMKNSKPLGTTRINIVL